MLAWAQVQSEWVAWRSPCAFSDSQLWAACTSPTALGSFQIQQKGAKHFLKQFSYFPSESYSPSAGTSNQALHGSGLSLGRQGRSSAWPGCSFRQAGLPASLHFLPLAREWDTLCSKSCPQLSFLFLFFFISVPLLCHCLSFAHCPHKAALPSASSTLLSPLWSPSHPLLPHAQCLPKVPFPVWNPLFLQLSVSKAFILKANQGQSVVRKWRSGEITGDRRKPGLEKPHFVLFFSSFGTG